jgi:ketosteroid isomerase-like protein
MSNRTPEEILQSIVEGINAGKIEALMTLYEPESCFALQPGEIVRGQQGVRQSLQGFIDMKGILELKVMRVIRTGNLALVISKWTFNGTGTNGSPANLAGTAADVLRQQSDGTWRMIIDNPWGTV